jgi:hypothetical protein
MEMSHGLHVLCNSQRCSKKEQSPAQRPKMWQFWLPEVVFVRPSQRSASRFAATPLDFGTIFAFSGWPSRVNQQSERYQLGHYSIIEQKTAASLPVTFSRRRAVDERLPPVPAGG